MNLAGPKGDSVVRVLTCPSVTYELWPIPTFQILQNANFNPHIVNPGSSSGASFPLSGRETGEKRTLLSSFQ
ncbi:hypothetical protein CEXT_143831 [Caerostris extrusa]|uniref:Uncharacterized protein n=1 Tax=Caerostris extrusa TaxID=172846 RepID=A0AAV4Y260_CAEEX|nr:hypothetical protein CEXT_143831 [Caerostris extrusa]